MQKISRLIDHALLNPSLTPAQIEEGIRIAIACDVASVCVQPYFLRRCSAMLTGAGIRASTTIGFPHGAHHTRIKIEEAKQAIADGGEELELVVNIGQVLGGNWNYVREDLGAVIAVTHDAGQKVKVIFENCYLNETQKIKLCEICAELQADWVKTSTGFGTGGATKEDVELMRKHSPANVQVKAAGGIKDLEAILLFRDLGASRIGCSRTAEILGTTEK